jgi:mevalonate kinase
MFSWLLKKKSASAAPDVISAYDQRYEPVMGHVISQFELVISEMKQLASRSNDASYWALNESIFRDAYLQGVLFGMCQSLEVCHRELKEAKETYKCLEKLMSKLAGAEIGKTSTKLSQNAMMSNKAEFVRGTSDGYGEGLTIQSLQKHDLVLQQHLRRGRACYAR